MKEISLVINYLNEKANLNFHLNNKTKKLISNILEDYHLMECYVVINEIIENAKTKEDKLRMLNPEFIFSTETFEKIIGE